MQTASAPDVGSAAESEKPNLEERKTMKNSMKLLALVLVAAAALFGAVQPAQAQATGSTAVSVNLNGIVILYYYSTVNVTLPSTLLGPNAVSAGTATNTATAVAGGAEATLTNPTSATAVTLGAVNLDILNAWSVRSLNYRQWEHPGHDRRNRQHADGGHRKRDHHRQPPGPRFNRHLRDTIDSVSVGGDLHHAADR